MELTSQLTAIAKKMGVNFSLKGRPVSHSEVFADTGVLPGLTKRADQLASLCFGYGLGASYEDVDSSLLGSRVKFDDYTPDVLRLMCITDVMFELKKSAPSPTDIALDELLYD